MLLTGSSSKGLPLNAEGHRLLSDDLWNDCLKSGLE